VLDNQKYIQYLLKSGAKLQKKQVGCIFYPTHFGVKKD